MKKNTPLPWLRTFVAAADCLSFTEAARELALTQAAVSKQMRSLELTLKQPLFVRKAHGLSLTEMGERYLIEVRAALAAIDGATEDLFGLRQASSVQLKVNISYSHFVLTPKLAKLYALLPDTPIELTHSIWDVNKEPLTGDIDIRYGQQPWPDVQAVRLGRDQLFPAIGKNSQLEPELPLINVLGYRSGWHWYAQQTGQSHWLARPQRSVDNSILAYQMAAAGLGVVLVRSSFMPHPWCQANLEPLAEAVSSEEGFFALLSPSASEATKPVWQWLTAKG